MNNLRFCLSGCGYLQKVWQDSPDCRLARIKMVHPFDLKNNHEEEIIIDCETDEVILRVQLDFFTRFLNIGENVLLKFQAEYKRFKGTYSGQTDDDPNQIILLQSKLLAIEECYVNGERIMQKHYLKAVA